MQLANLLNVLPEETVMLFDLFYYYCTSSRHRRALVHSIMTSESGVSFPSPVDNHIEPGRLRAVVLAVALLCNQLSPSTTVGE